MLLGALTCCAGPRNTLNTRKLLGLSRVTAMPHAIYWLMDFFEPHCKPKFTLGGESEITQGRNEMKSKGTELH